MESNPGSWDPESMLLWTQILEGTTCSTKGNEDENACTSQFTFFWLIFFLQLHPSKTLVLPSSFHMLLLPCRNFLADPIFVSPSPYHYMGPVSDPPTPSTPQPHCPIVFQRITNCPVYKLQFDFNKLNSKPSDSNGHHHLPTRQGAKLLMLHHHTVFT